MNNFDAKDELTKILKERKVRKKRITWGKSRLNKYRAELLQLRNEGASYGDLRFWLRKEKRISIDRSNIMRFLNKNLPDQSQD